MSTTLTTKTTTEPANGNGQHASTRPRAKKPRELVQLPHGEWVPRDAIIDIDGPGIEFEGGEDEKGHFLPAPVEQWELRPSHPGEIMADLFLPSTGLTQAELAVHLGVTRRVLSQVINGTRRVDVDLAQRLGRAFKTDAAFWLGLQRKCDLWDAAHANTSAYEHIQPLQRAA